MSELQNWREQVKSAQEVLDATHPAIPGGTGKTLAEANKRITELEASLADSNEALQVMALLLSEADAVNSALVTEAAHQTKMIEAGSRRDERKINVIKNQNEQIAALKKKLRDEYDDYPADELQDQSHSANTVGGPTPVAAPACEQLAKDEDAVYAVAYKLCLQDGADEDSAHTLIWEGHPPEPWGEVWMRYEFQARELLKALDERRALMANHQATFQSGHECVSRVSNSDGQMNKQDDTRNAGESDS